jgi:hypothetical protein
MKMWILAMSVASASHPFRGAISNGFPTRGGSLSLAHSSLISRHAFGVQSVAKWLAHHTLNASDVRIAARQGWQEISRGWSVSDTPGYHTHERSHPVRAARP